MKRVFTALVALIVLAGGGLAGAAYYLLDPAELKPRIVDIVQNETGRPLTIEGELTRSLGLSPAIVVQDIALAAPDWAKQPETLKADSLSVRFSLLPLLYGQFQIDTIELSGAKLWLETDGTRESWALTKNSDAETPKDTEADKQEQTDADESEIRIAQLTIAESEVHYHDHQTGEQHTLSVGALSISDIDGDDVGALTLTGHYQEAPIQLEAQLMDDVLHASASLTPEGANATLKGSVSLEDEVFDLNLSLQADELRQLLALAGETSDDTAPVSLSASLGGTSKVLSISKLTAGYDGHSVTGTGKLDLSQAKPKLTGVLHAEKLDFSGQKAAPSDTQTTNDAAPSQSESIIPDAPLPVDALGALDASLELSSGEVILDDTSFPSAAAKLVLENKRLALSDIALEKADGKLRGEMVLNARTEVPSYSLSLNTDHLTLGALRAALTGDDSVKGGFITAHLDLAGSGASLQPMLQSAKGSYDMLIEEATYMPPKNVQQASAFFDLLRGGEKDGAVTMKCGLAHFDIKDGIARTNSLAVQSPAAIVSGKGQTDLGKQQVHIELKARSTVLGFADVVPPLVIDGPWANPSVTLSAESTLLNIGKIALGVATGGVGFIAFGDEFTDKLGITAENNPCLKALNEANEKAAQADADPKAAYKAGEDNVRAIRDDVKGNVKDSIKDVEKDVKVIRDGLKGLFKKD